MIQKQGDYRVFC